MEDKVVVLCYGQRETWKTRQDALRFYKECAEMTEGSERERYVNIVFDLMDNKSFCSDGDEEYREPYNGIRVYGGVK